jgi:MFS family permease
MTIGDAALAAPGTAVARSLRERLTLGVILGTNILNMLSITALAPVLALVAAHFADRPVSPLITGVFGHSSGGALVAQLMITLLGIGIMVGGPIVGWVMERIGHRRLLCVALALYAVTGAAGLWLEDSSQLLLARLLQGVACAGISMSILSMIGDRYDGEARARILGLQGTVVSASGLLSLLAAGGIAELGGWRGPFAMYLLAVPVLAIALVAAPAPAPRAAAVARTGAASAALWRLWPFYLMLVPFYMAAYMTTVHLSFVLAGDGVTRASAQAMIMMASMVLNIIGAFSYPKLMQRFGRRWVFVVILAIFGTSNLVIGLWANAVGTTVGCWIAGLAGGLMTPFFTNTILDRAAPEMRGRAIGLMYTMMYIGDFLNPFLITPMRVSIGNHPTFAVVGAAVMAAALLQAAMRRSPVGD